MNKNNFVIKSIFIYLCLILPNITIKGQSSVEKSSFIVTNLPITLVTRPQIVKIVKERDRTLISFLLPVDGRGSAVEISDTYAMVDETYYSKDELKVGRIQGDCYMVRGYYNSTFPLNQSLRTGDYSGKVLAYTLVFPPLQRSVKTISIRDVRDEVKGSRLYFYNVNVKEYLDAKFPNVIADPNIRRDVVNQNNQKYQYSFAPYNPNRMFNLISIERFPDKTRVTYSASCHNNNQTISFSTDFCMIDKKTGDIYRASYLENGYQYGRSYDFRSVKGKVLEFTQVFPPLKSGVKIVDIYSYSNYERYKADKGLQLAVFENVKLKDYNPQKKQKNQPRVFR